MANLEFNSKVSYINEKYVKSQVWEAKTKSLEDYTYVNFRIREEMYWHNADILNSRKTAVKNWYAEVWKAFCDTHDLGFKTLMLPVSVVEWGNASNISKTFMEITGCLLSREVSKKPSIEGAEPTTTFYLTKDGRVLRHTEDEKAPVYNHYGVVTDSRYFAEARYVDAYCAPHWWLGEAFMFLRNIKQSQDEIRKTLLFPDGTVVFK